MIVVDENDVVINLVSPFCFSSSLVVIDDAVASYISSSSFCVDANIE